MAKKAKLTTETIDKLQIDRGIKPMRKNKDNKDVFIFDIFENLLEDIKNGKVPVNVGGHNCCKEDLDVNRKEDEYMLTSMIMLTMRSIGNDLYTFSPAGQDICYQCNEKIILTTDGKKIWCENPCKYPDGHPAYEIELNVPSGKMVVGNDFRDGFIVNGDYNINMLGGQIKTTKKYADIGLAYAFVGNTCPQMYKINDEKFIIGCSNYVDDDYDNPIPPIDNAEEVAQIMTDLWWYSIADYDEFIRRYDNDPNINQVDIVVCKPGVYRFSHQYHLVPQDNSQPQIFTNIEWLREPDPIKNYKEEYNKISITAGQAVMRSMENWSFMYENNIKGMMHSVHSILDQDERDWHPNGWALSDPDITNDMPSVDIPIFEERFNCTELSDYSVIAQAAGVGKSLCYKRDITLNESYTALAFNMLRAIILYGTMTVSCYNDEDNKKLEKRTKAFAKKIIKGLAKRYPDRIPENCKKLC